MFLPSSLNHGGCLSSDRVAYMGQGWILPQLCHTDFKVTTHTVWALMSTPNPIVSIASLK